MAESVSVPPARRTPLGASLAQHADDARLFLPRCDDCGEVQYPLRERCGGCLGDALVWTEVSDTGKLLTWTRVHASVEPWFRERAPWAICKVKLECGPIVIAHLLAQEPEIGMPVRVNAVLDASGAPVLQVQAE